MVQKKMVNYTNKEEHREDKSREKQTETFGAIRFTLENNENKVQSNI